MPWLDQQTWPLLPDCRAESMLIPEIPLDFRMAVSFKAFLEPFAIGKPECLIGCVVLLRFLS